MSYIILVRNPQRGGVMAIDDGDGEHPQIVQYDTEDDAEAAAKDISICQSWPYSVVEAP